jgi:hypothetical protein
MLGMKIDNPIRDALGYTVEWVDRNILRHRFDRVCKLGFELLNGKDNEQ